jgi:predicted phage terminase large subunit-like protein
VYRGRVEYPALKRAVENMAAKWNPDAVLIEDKSSGQALIQDMRADTRLPIIARMPHTDKLSRMMAVSSFIESGACLLPEAASWIIDFEHEIASFPNGAHDDQVDSVSQFLAYMKEKTYAATPSIRRIG